MISSSCRGSRICSLCCSLLTQQKQFILKVNYPRYFVSLSSHTFRTQTDELTEPKKPQDISGLTPSKSHQQGSRPSVTFIRNFTTSSSYPRRCPASAAAAGMASANPPGIGTGKKARMNVDLDDSVEEYLLKHKLKPKDHPGVFNLKRTTLPEKFINAAERILSHENIKDLEERATRLRNYLWSRHLPIEEYQYKEKVTQIEDKISMKDAVLLPFLSEKQLERLEQSREQKIRSRLKKRIYHWEPLDYSRNKALEYLLCRSAGEYAVLFKIFNEIQRRDPSFFPKNLCDFGSGIGTAVWASHMTWPKSLGEYLCADVSREMNDLAELILRGGNVNNDHGIPGLYFRQFLPQSSTISYDIVVSAYSLMELPSTKARLEMLDILWKKTKNYLVVVEQGTNAGFKAIIEARDYILQLDQSETNRNAHVFSPCPNDTFCPRYIKDDIPCNFHIKYKPLYPFNREDTKTECYTYVVLKKGPRTAADEQWPRLISDPMRRRRHVICRLCTKEGNLAEVVLTKSKHSANLYRVGRKSACGDLLPVKEIQSLDPSTSSFVDENDQTDFSTTKNE